MHSNDKTAFLETVVQIADRNIKPYGTEGSTRMASLLLALKRIEWTVSLGSEGPASRIWSFLSKSGVDMDWVRSMVSEFMFHSDFHVQREELAAELASSITWIGSSGAVPPEYQQLSSSAQNAKQLLVKSPWLVFLYLLHISDVVHLVSMKVER